MRYFWTVNKVRSNSFVWQKWVWEWCCDVSAVSLEPQIDTEEAGDKHWPRVEWGRHCGWWGCGVFRRVKPDSCHVDEEHYWIRKEFLYLYLHHQNYKNHIFCFSFLSHCCADLSLIKYFKNINQTTFNGQPVYRAAQQGNDRAPEMDFSVLFWISSVNHGAARPRWEFVLHYESTHITETETRAPARNTTRPKALRELHHTSVYCVFTHYTCVFHVPFTLTLSMRSVHIHNNIYT